jgi:hypothetical protein
VVFPGVALAAFLVHGISVSIATLTLAGDHDWAGVWIGSTPGMVSADGLVIGVGTWLHQRLPAKLVHVLASLLFHVFGPWILFDSALGWRPAAITVATAVALAAAIAAVIHRSQTSRRRRTRAAIAGSSPDVVRGADCAHPLSRRDRRPPPEVSPWPAECIRARFRTGRAMPRQQR